MLLISLYLSRFSHFLFSFVNYLVFQQEKNGHDKSAHQALQYNTAFSLSFFLCLFYFYPRMNCLLYINHDLSADFLHFFHSQVSTLFTTTTQKLQWLIIHINRDRTHQVAIWVVLLEQPLTKLILIMMVLLIAMNSALS